MASFPSLLLLMYVCLEISVCQCAPLLHSFGGYEAEESYALVRQMRDTDSDDHEDVSHNHEIMCDVVGNDVARGFNDIAEELSITGPDGVLCSHNVHTSSAVHDFDSTANLTCGVLYEFVSRVLVRLNLTTECCLENGTSCGHQHSKNGASTAEVYGYGFLMILAVSACSLAGVPFIPLLKKNSKFGQFYKYFYSLMIALGASALFCDAVLHLIPEAFGLHDHDHSEDDVAEDEAEEKSYLWKGCVIVAGTYFFFLFETILHTWNQHSHGVDDVLGKHQDHLPAQEQSLLSDNQPKAKYGSTRQQEITRDAENDQLLESSFSNNNTTGERRESYANFKENVEPDCRSNECLEPTVPHGPCQDTRGGTSGIIHPGLKESGETQHTPLAASPNCFARTWQYLLNVKPLAWLIIFGDAIHNFADGLALGAAISQSLSLGISTMIALMFHEIPHELGDFVILLSTGMRWYTALFFNLMSQLTGIVGFFVGVAISTQNEEANGWILAIAAGVFLYIALVDLLPGLIHTKEKGCTRWGQFLMANLGFVVAFGALLALAAYEEQLNLLISL